MSINFSPSDYAFAGDIRTVLDEVLSNHPLRGNILAELPAQFILSVEMHVGNAGGDPNIDCDLYPTVIMNLGEGRYYGEMGLDRELLYREMCHELTHLIDRKLDSSFGITSEKEECARCVSRGVSPLIHMDLWNLCINGRLWRKGVHVESFDQFRQKRFGKKLDRGLINMEAIEPYKKAFDSDSLTFDEIVHLAKEASNLLRSA